MPSTTRVEELRAHVQTRLDCLPSIMSKRRVEEDPDDALSALTTAMQTTSTTEPGELVALICSILGVDADTASFYLEASGNDPHAAVNFHLSRGGQPKRARRPEPAVSKHAGTVVSIAGLPEGWSARISSAGTIVFTHAASGTEQATVPPEFNTAAPTTSTDDTCEAMMGDAATDASLLHNPSAPASAPASPPQSSIRAAAAAAAPAPRPHPLVICDGCEQNVMGTRYRCLTRDNVDLCEACFWSGSEPSAALRAGQEWMRMSFVAA